AGQKLLLVDRLQHHDDRSLCHLVLKRRNAERPLRAVRFRNVDPAHRRGDISAGLDALQESRKVGLQVRLVLRRRHSVDASCSILARQPVRLSHPFQIHDMVKRGQSCPRLRPRQFGYPLSFRGQVRGAQGLLPCFPATALIPWRPPSLVRVPVSPVPRGQRYYEGATTSRLRIPGRLSVSPPGSARSSALRARLGGAPGWLEDPSRPGIWSAGRPFAGTLSLGRKRDLTGSQAVHPMPLPRSKTPAGPTILTLTVSSMLPPLYPQRRLQRS